MIEALVSSPVSSSATSAATSAAAAVGAAAASASAPAIGTRTSATYGYLPIVQHFTVQSGNSCLASRQQRHLDKSESFGLPAVFVLYDVYRGHFSESREFVP
jgi:hypothetical protein